MLAFEPITIERQDDYRKIFADCPQKTSDYSFVNLWGWAEEYGLQWTWQEDLTWIKQTRPDTTLWAPIGRWQDVDWPQRLAELDRGGATFIRVPEELAQIWLDALPGAVRADADRGQWDYLYRVSELIELPGNRYHKKKNLLNQFLKKYRHAYRELGTEMVEQALAMQSDWCTWRDCESSENLAAENRVIERVLRNWDRFYGLTGGALLADDRMAAYTVAEPLHPEMLLIHFEKANPEFKGGYQAVNQLFLSHSAANFKLVNREQDLADEGLRKAKLSYHPVDFLRKFKVEIAAL